MILMFLPKAIFSQTETFRPKYSTILKVKEKSNTLRMCSRITPSEIESYYDLKKEDAQKLEKNMTGIYKLEAKKVYCGDNKIKDLASFGYQYLGIVIKGKKYIYVNAFFLTKVKDSGLNFLKRNWKRKLVNVCDGAGGFWGVLYDVEEKKFSDLEFNDCG